jgi:hypothetical protein
VRDLCVLGGERLNLHDLISDDRPHVFDGAMGTMLYQRGVFINRCYDELVLRDPDLVADVHRAYVEAGAELIETNTFGANAVKLAQYGLESKVREINEAAARLAMAAAEPRRRPAPLRWRPTRRQWPQPRQAGAPIRRNCAVVSTPPALDRSLAFPVSSPWLSAQRQYRHGTPPLCQSRLEPAQEVWVACDGELCTNSHREPRPELWQPMADNRALMRN